MTATVWQRTSEWEPDPAQPRETLITIAIDTARNGELILLVNDEQTDSLLAGAALRSQSDLQELFDRVAAQLNYEVKRSLEQRAKPTSRLINRAGPQRW